MASSRDDFVIAIRSAFLKKSTKQKFSLLTLVFLSILIITLSSFDFKIIRQTKNIINEIVYRSSLIVSYPENFILRSIDEIIDYSTFYERYKKNVLEIENLNQSDEITPDKPADEVFTQNTSDQYSNSFLTEIIPLFLPFLALPSIRILFSGLIDVKTRSFLKVVTG